MTPDDLKRIGTMLYGSTFAPDLATALGTSARTIQRYLSGERGIPDDMKKRLKELGRKRMAEIRETVS